MTQDFFISEDGYINLKVKIESTNESDREQIISDLFYMMKKEEKFATHFTIQQIYFKDQNPITAINQVKGELIEHLNKTFEDLITRQ